MSPRELKTRIGAPSQIINPHIHALMRKDLLRRGPEGWYEITPLGDMIITIASPAIDNLIIIDKYPEFFRTHDLSGIPGPLRVRLRDLADAELVTSTDVQFFQPKLKPFIARAEWIHTLGSFAHPEYPAIYLDAGRRGIPVSVIVDNGLMELLEARFSTELDAFLALPNTELFLTDLPMNIGVLVTNKICNLVLHYPNGDADPARDLVSRSERGRGWGRDLWEWYMSRSQRL